MQVELQGHSCCPSSCILSRLWDFLLKVSSTLAFKEAGALGLNARSALAERAGDTRGLERTTLHSNK